MKSPSKASFSLIFFLLASLAIIALSFIGCTTIKEGYVQKEYGYGTTAESAVQVSPTPQQSSENKGTSAVQTKPATITPVAKPVNTTVTVTKPSTTTTNTTKTGTGTITQASKTITVEHLDFANVNLIVVTGIKNVELTVGSSTYLFKNPRVDTDETICFINVNGVDHIVSKDGGDYPLNGISLDLRDARSARSMDYTQCEFYVKNN